MGLYLLFKSSSSQIPLPICNAEIGRLSRSQLSAPYQASVTSLFSSILLFRIQLLSSLGLSRPWACCVQEGIQKLRLDSLSDHGQPLPHRIPLSSSNEPKERARLDQDWINLRAYEPCWRLLWGRVPIHHITASWTRSCIPEQVS
jgi:hypothetical protein